MMLLMSACPVCSFGMRIPLTLLDDLKTLVANKHYALSHACSPNISHHHYLFRRWLVVPQNYIMTTIDCVMCGVWFPLPNNLFFVDYADEA